MDFTLVGYRGKAPVWVPSATASSPLVTKITFQPYDAQRMAIQYLGFHVKRQKELVLSGNLRKLLVELFMKLVFAFVL